MRRVPLGLRVAACVAWLTTAAVADPPHRATLILSTARAPDGRGCSAFGTGLAVGGGLVLTAAHVLLTPTDLTTTCGFAAAAVVRTDVTFGAGPHTGRVLTQGRRIETPRMHFADASDYAILRVPVPMHGPALRPCATRPRAGQRVRILTRGGVLDAAVATRQTVKQGDDAAYVDVDRVVANGDSGAGVLDAATGCVLGLVSHAYPAMSPIVTRITPAAVFAQAWAQAR